MDWAEFISSVIGHIISWPVAVILLAIIFRSSISDLLSKTRFIKSPIGEAGFGEEVKELEEQREVLPEAPSPAGAGVIDAISPGALYEEISPIAERTPSAAVPEAWRRIELALAQLYRKRGFEFEGFIPAHEIVRTLRKSGVLDASFSMHLDDLRKTRNRVTHSQETPSAAEALAYLDVASSAYASIKYLTQLEE